MRTWACCATLLLSSSALAETCPVPKGGSEKLAALDATERIDFLHRVVDEQGGYAKTWKWAWVGIGSATLAGSALITVAWAAGHDPLVRDTNIVDNLIVTGFSVVTPVASLLLALRVESDAPAIDKLLRETANGRAGSCLVLARMEELFAKDADEEAFNTGWFTQITSVLGLGALFSIFAVEAATASTAPNPACLAVNATNHTTDACWAIQSSHWQNAILNTAAGAVLTEAQILSTPTGAVSGYKQYLRGELARPKAKPIAWTVAPLGVAPGISVRFTF